MENLRTQIDRQFEYSRRKNIFCNLSNNVLSFQPETIAYLRQNHQAIKTLTSEEENSLTKYLVDGAIRSLCQANQFYYFNELDKATLKKLYIKLLSKLKALPESEEKEAYKQIATKHFIALQSFLRMTNPFARHLYSNKEPYLEQEVVCEEYTAATQLHLLHIDIATLKEPILDLGCGQQAHLVRYLRDQKLEAYGIDRSVSPSSHTFKADWFEFSLSDKTWGTIISNLGFSNHFLHHHLRVGGDYANFGIRYKEILHALKIGGTFYYAPDLPFIENYLKPEEFLLQRFAVEGTEYKAIKVTRLGS
ncbi:class I SAM-dependent methyltransferase [Pontibacter fetidus]|uniref:Class I SAM-dependent methyltransferase n=1 Tax=Pontibacter fetidus TaxID=2700082 RepID=A0A6B2H932_9BACT|nr:class I SAM-dependent methyltransferase [Pontibacter fetidus]NDK55734.1 class I SAM-dependent methyltransferase [Pontibacter fetidus]